MKKIKINFLDFWSDFDKENNIFTNILKKHFDVEISNNPDFLFVTYMTFTENPYAFTEYDCVRILVSWDTLYPDFNVFDYAITNWQIECSDRHLWYPIAFVEIENMLQVQEKHKYVTENILNTKTEFCDFIYSRGNEKGNWRDKAFEALSKYKPVISAGSYRNNDPEGNRVTINTKLPLQKKCKFSVSFEGIVEAGYISEKIFDSYRANSIPIYYGHNSTAEKVLNSASYINIADYDYDFDRVIGKIKELDENEELYLEMLKQPVFISDTLVEDMYSSLEQFLIHICSQNPEDAIRRIKELRPYQQELLLNRFYKICTKYKLFYWIVVVLEKLK